MKTHYGCKFFRFMTDGSMELLRVVRMKNESTFVLKNEEGLLIKKSEQELQDDYTRLNPDAYISLSIVELDNGSKDVVLTLHRREEIKNGDSSPYVICRQSIYDFFTNQMVKIENLYYIGMSISRETCPPELNFDGCAICNKINYTQMIDVYLDDKFEDIYGLLNSKRADPVLESLAAKAPFNIRGYERSLKDLMINTRFMYDFLRAFNIYPVNFKVTILDGDIIPVEQVQAIEDIIKYSISAVCVLPYAKDIDLSKIQKDYILISDSEENCYIVAYIKGEYINRPYEALEDHRDRDMMITMVKNRYM